MKKSETAALERMYRAGINEQKVNKMQAGKIAKETCRKVIEGKSSRKGEK